jgi:hypothetical protein
LKGKGSVGVKGHYLTFSVDDRSMILFRDGRARLGGMESPADALKFYTQYVGM